MMCERNMRFLRNPRIPNSPEPQNHVALGFKLDNKTFRIFLPRDKRDLRGWKMSLSSLDIRFRDLMKDNLKSPRVWFYVGVQTLVYGVL